LRKLPSKLAKLFIAMPFRAVFNWASVVALTSSLLAYGSTTAYRMGRALRLFLLSAWHSIFVGGVLGFCRHVPLFH